MSERYDVVVIGAGMVGAAVAALLANRSDLAIAVLDASDPYAGSAGEGDYGLRVSAISRASQRVLERCGAWDAIAAARVSPYRRMCVWDSDAGPGATNTIRFDCADIGERDLGHIVENDLIRQSLLTRLVNATNVELVQPARVEELGFRDDGVEVVTDGRRRFMSDLAVGADGAGSVSRGLAGIETQAWAYEQNGVVAAVRSENPHEETAWQRFLPGGPLAFLPLADGRCSIVWSTAPDHAASLLEMDDTAFNAALTEASGGVLGDLAVTGPRAAFPLRAMFAKAYTRAGFALVGDAAHTVHPLAGQGVNLGFLDAAALVQLLGEACEAGRPLGEAAVLRRYERWRKGENLAMTFALDGIKHLFGSSLPALASLRRAGLGIVDQAGPVKDLLIRRAMGLAGDLPDAARAG